MFLCLCMMLTLVDVMLPTARATYKLGFPFDKEITDNNPFKDTTNNNGAYPCTLYAWQRVSSIDTIT